MNAASPQTLLPTCFAPAEIRSGAELREQTRELDRSGRLRSLIDSIPGLVAVLNLERQILLANTAWEEMARQLGKQEFVGLRPGEFLSCRWAVSALHGCGTSEACRECGVVQSILCAQGGERAVKECRITSVYREAFDFRVTASPLEWQGQDYVLTVFSDISDEKRRQALEKIFFHDVLNTAGGISGIAALIADEPELSYELKDDLLLSAEMLVSEIKSHRMLLAAENNHLSVECVAVNARVALESARKLYGNHPAATGRKIEIDLGGTGFEVRTDPTILQRILGNMLKNALEATPCGGRVWLGADASPEAFTFWCQNGGEIPHAQALQVFQRSYSTKGSGRGLGTYSMKLLGEKFLRGAVSFTTSAEEGTRFQISLPRT